MSQFSLNVIKFEDVRSKIVETLQANSEYSGVFDFEAANISMMIDTMAYVSMLMSYQMTNLTNNLFLDTTTMRTNAVSIAKNVGYRPKRSTSAKITGTIKYYDADKTFTTEKIVIPAQTQFMAEGGYVFVNISPIELTVSPDDARALVSDISVVEGSFKTFTYLGNGEPFQKFIIPSKTVEENNFNLYVKSNIDNVKNRWDEVKQSFNLISMDSYFVEEDNTNEGHVKVIFGDGIVSNYPSNIEVVIVEYLETNADKANNIALVSFNTAAPSASFAGYDVAKFNAISSTTTKSYGGTPIETLAGIQDSAPKSFAMAGRAVTKNDYNNLMATNAYILDSNVIGGDELFKGDSTKLGNIYLTGVPLYIDSTNFLDSNEIYLTLSEETQLLTELNRYRIVGTKLQFMKPSYIYMNVTPTIEIPLDLKATEEEALKVYVTDNLNTYVDENYKSFNPTIRSSRLNGAVGSDKNILSSELAFEYYFVLAKSSFYVGDTSETNFILIPIKVESRDDYGNITGVSNFIKTNIEQKMLLGYSEDAFLPYNERTIYGKLDNNTIDRYIYNEDVVVDGSAEDCNIMIKGDNKFFSFYLFANDYNSNIISAQKIFYINNAESTASVVLSVDGTYPDQMDSYTISIGNDPVFATIKRTSSKFNGFKGLVTKEADIVSTTHGDFYEAATTFTVSGNGVDKTFDSLLKGDYIIYNANLSGGRWIKTTDLGVISAADDSELFKGTQEDTMYQISISGDFGGKTVALSAGDVIIFNTDSTVNPTYKWEKINYKVINYDSLNGLDASIDLPVDASDYEIKCVTNVIGSTNFGGRTNISFEDNDIIYFDPTEVADEDKWKLMIKSADITSLPASATVDASAVSGSLSQFNYDPDIGIEIGRVVRVVNIGSFGSDYIYVNWNGIAQAYYNDVMIYTGLNSENVPKWNIYQPSYPSLFNIDGSDSNSLPINLTYGDTFTIAVSGDFNGGQSVVYETTDNIVYVGDNTWTKFVVQDQQLDASSVSGLPIEATVGDMCLVNEDGNFLNSYIISPASDNFVQGDYIIFNGTNWTKMKEYTIEYALINNETTGKDYLNEIGFNSDFYYIYNSDNSNYEMYFDDIFSGTNIGTFKYSTESTNITSIYEVGKLMLNTQIVGKYNMTSNTDPTNIVDLFETDSNNLIKILPRNKLDINGAVTNDVVTDFDTFFNNYVIININPTSVTK